MKIRPVITEKSTADAKQGWYTFWVAPSANKREVKEGVREMFSVNPVSVRTSNTRKTRLKRNYLRQNKKVSALKKVFVKLTGKEKIDLFLEDKKKK